MRANFFIAIFRRICQKESNNCGYRWVFSYLVEKFYRGSLETSWSSKEAINDSFSDVYFGFLSPATTAKKNNKSKTWLWNFPRERRASHREYQYRGEKTLSTTLERNDKSPAILAVCVTNNKAQKFYPVVLPLWGICKLVSSLFVAEGVVVVFITKHAIGWVRRD